MSGSRQVGLRSGASVQQALADGQIVAVPALGSYALVALQGSPAAQRRFDVVAGGRRTELGPHLLVGQRDQARALAASWTEELQRLVERCWPGPLTLLLRSAAPGTTTVRVSMLPRRPLRRLCRQSGPWLMAPLPYTTPAQVAAEFGAPDVALIVDGGRCDGPDSTLVDGTVEPLRVCLEGALPAAFIEAALIMGTRRRRWFGISARQ